MEGPSGQWGDLPVVGCRFAINLYLVRWMMAMPCKPCLLTIGLVVVGCGDNRTVPLIQGCEERPSLYQTDIGHDLHSSYHRLTNR